jgi:L,D-transpeptidase YcbB
MRAIRHTGVAAGAGLALALAVSDHGLATGPAEPQANVPIALVAPSDAAKVDALIPVPEPADVPPPTVADIGPAEPKQAAKPVEKPADVVTASIPDDAAILRAIPVPDAANVPPPTAKDVGAPLGRMAAADLPIAERLRDALSKPERAADRKRERAVLETFYKERGYVPLWMENGKPNERMKSAIARIRAADADGLDASDYAIPSVANDDADSLADAELKMTNVVLAYAKHAASGRTSPNRISTNIEYTPPVLDQAKVLAGLAGAKDVAKEIDGFNPPHPEYKALRAKLAELRGTKGEAGPIQIASGPTLKKGMSDPRVPVLRERLGVAGEAGSQVYDAALSDAVKAFQKQKGIAANGLLNPGTIVALNGRTRSKDIDIVISNMERWRWLPRELGHAHVMINIPDFTLKVMKGDTVAWRTKIVVGKQATPTPVFSDEIENIQVNPTWHVPQSIIHGEYLPALAQDPTVLARMGLILGRNSDGSISVRQPPGERNALGRIKFNFPNRFQVYLHDTPDKHLFAHDRRSYSHGCMRVQNPHQFGEVLASIALPQERYTAERFTKMYGSGEQWIKFKAPVPVHITYMNAYVDEAGKLVIKEDLYGYDGRVQSALRGTYVQVAERSQRVEGAGGSAVRRAAPQRQRQVVHQAPQQHQFFFPFFR